LNRELFPQGRKNEQLNLGWHQMEEKTTTIKRLVIAVFGTERNALGFEQNVRKYNHVGFYG
jgi:hypothetical protein